MIDESQETEVMLPPTPALAPRPASVTAEKEPKRGPEWHWCPACKLASSKAGTCVGCGRAYVRVPETGVSSEPHMPRVPVGRSRAAAVVSLLGKLALLAAAGAGIFLLASHGNVDDTGDTASAGTVVDGTSAYGIGVLHGTLRLQGSWKAATMQPMQLDNAVTAGAAVKPVLTIAKGSETIQIARFLSTDPSSVLNQYVTQQPQHNPDGMGNTITVEPSRDVSIAGFNAVAQDLETRNAKGGLLFRGTQYAVNAGGEVVIIKTQAAPAQANDLLAIEQALSNVG